jgi:hypothetical protein
VTETQVSRYARLWERHVVDLGGADALIASMSPTIHYEDINLPAPVLGREQFRGLLATVFSRYQGMSITVDRSMMAAQDFAMEWTFRGTHSETERPFAVQGASFGHFDGQLVVFQRDYWSVAALRERLTLA